MMDGIYLQIDETPSLSAGGVSVCCLMHWEVTIVGTSRLKRLVRTSYRLRLPHGNFHKDVFDDPKDAIAAADVEETAQQGNPGWYSSTFTKQESSLAKGMTTLADEAMSAELEGVPLAADSDPKPHPIRPIL